MPIALHNLIRDGIRGQPHFGTDIFFDFRPLMGKCPHRAGKFADGNVFPGRLKTCPVPARLFVPDCQLESERHRLAMDTMRTADHHRMAMLQRALFQDGNQLIKIFEDEVERLRHLYRQGRIVGGVYTSLPANCVYKPVSATNYFQCGAMWLTPAYGANGLYYKVVAAP